MGSRGASAALRPDGNKSLTRQPKRPRDPNQLAKHVVDLATMDESERTALSEKKKDSRFSKKSPVDTHNPGKRGST